MTFAFMGPLLRFVGFQREVTVDGATVPASLHVLCETYPDLRPVLLDADGQLRTVHRVCLNDRPCHHPGRAERADVTG